MHAFLYAFSWLGSHVCLGDRVHACFGVRLVVRVTCV